MFLSKRRHLLSTDFTITYDLQEKHEWSPGHQLVYILRSRLTDSSIHGHSYWNEKHEILTVVSKKRILQNPYISLLWKALFPRKVKALVISRVNDATYISNIIHNCVLSLRTRVVQFIIMTSINFYNFPRNFIFRDGHLKRSFWPNVSGTLS